MKSFIMDNANINNIDESNKFMVEGYDFSEIADVYHNTVKSLYISFESMSDYYDAREKMYKYGNRKPNQFYGFDEGWEFENSGYYKGFIIDLIPSRKHKNEFLVKFLINDTQVRILKLKCGDLNDPLFNAIHARLSKEQNTDGIDLNGLMWRSLLVKIQKIRMRNGKYFSEVKEAFLLSSRCQELLDCMLDIMIEQSNTNSKEETA